MKSFIWYIHLVLGLLVTIPRMLWVERHKPTMSAQQITSASYAVARAYARSQVNFTGSTIEIVGHENIPKNDTVLFVSNHQSNFDTGILLGFIDREKGFIAKDGMLKIPVLRTWMHGINCVFMDRHNIRNAAKAIIDGITLLKSGVCMVVFPEGTRSKCATMGEFKGGSFKLATKAKVPIIPITINGSYNIMEGNGNRIKAAHVRVIIHPAIQTATLTTEEIAALPDTTRAIIAAGLEKS